MSLRKTVLTIATATAVAASAFTPVAHAQSSDDSSQESFVSSSASLSSEDAEGTVDIPVETEDDEKLSLIDELHEHPIIGSALNPPEWITLPLAVLKAVMAIGTFGATAASFMVKINPEFKSVVRNFFAQLGINVNA